MTLKKDTKFRFKRPQYMLLARILRYSTIPEKHKRQLIQEMIPYMLEDNSSFDYRWFFRMVMGADYKGVDYDV